MTFEVKLYNMTNFIMLAFIIIPNFNKIKFQTKKISKKKLDTKNYLQ